MIAFKECHINDFPRSRDVDVDVFQFCPWQHGGARCHAASTMHYPVVAKVQKSAPPSLPPPPSSHADKMPVASVSTSLETVAIPQ